MGRHKPLISCVDSACALRGILKHFADLEQKMEVEEQGGGDSYVSSGSSGGSVNISLHPLVIMNISDHFTRVRMQQEEETGLPTGALQIELFHVKVYVSSVYGVLLGTQKGRSIEICNSFEVVVGVGRQLDRDYFASKEEQCELFILKLVDPS